MTANKSNLHAWSTRQVLTVITILTVGVYKRSWFFSGDEDLLSSDYDDGLQFDKLSTGFRTNVRQAAPPLRGCRGDPARFVWHFPDGMLSSESELPIRATAGTTLRTRLAALDFYGRPARTTSCSMFRINATIDGHARLSQDLSTLDWDENAELLLDFDNDVSETVDFNLQIVDSIGNRVRDGTQKARVAFAAGKLHHVDVNVRAVSSGWSRGSQSDLPAGANASNTTGNLGTWPTHIVLEVLLDARDRLGNRLTADDAAPSLMLRSSSRDVDMLRGGHFEDGETGEARTLIRAAKPGTYELMLELSTCGNETSADLNLPSLQISFDGNVAEDARKGATVAQELSAEDVAWAPLADEVREAFRHAWRGYRRFAWGTDELKPVSKQGQDSFGNIGMSVLDSLTTLHIMGMHTEFEQGADFVNKHLDFDSADREVSVFELTIRALGGLLGAHSLTGRPIFLTRAVELGDRILPALNSSSGFPFPRWNIARQGGPHNDEPTVLAEAGSLQLEFRYLTAATGDVRYGKAADACFDAIEKTGVTGLVPVQLTPPDRYPPKALNSRIAMGANADSYYEYLLKQWLQSPTEERFKNMWLLFMEQFPNLVRPEPTQETLRSSDASKFKLIELAPSGGAPMWKMDHLSCFTPGMIALGVMTLPEADLPSGSNETWVKIAEGLTASCVKMWTQTKSGLAPEYTLLKKEIPHALNENIPAEARHSFLRPETAESLFYLYRLTGKEKYRKWGKKLFNAIVKHAKTDAGYASVSNVNTVPTEKIDNMQSFVLAETFKYLYLLFSPEEALDLSKYVLNTEAHPLRKIGKL